MTRLLRPCLTCGRPCRGPRCDLHQLPIRKQGQQGRVKRTWPERLRRRAAVEEHVREVGWICPGWGRPPHPSEDLTADHVIAQAIGGAEGPLQVLCRSCNGRKAARFG